MGPPMWAYSVCQRKVGRSVGAAGRPSGTTATAVGYTVAKAASTEELMSLLASDDLLELQLPPDDTTEACSPPSGYVTTGEDCDDTDAGVSPNAREICDDADNDCDGSVDEAFATLGDDFSWGELREMERISASHAARRGRSEGPHRVWSNGSQRLPSRQRHDQQRYAEAFCKRRRRLY